MSELINAAINGNIEQVESLVAEGADIETRDANGDTALTLAAANGYTNLVTYLLDAGADVAANCYAGNTALCAAAGRGHRDVVTILLDRGAQPNACNGRGYSPVLLAVHSEEETVVHALLQHGADPNIGDKGGITPLKLAANRGAVDCLTALLSGGANAQSAGTALLVLALSAPKNSEAGALQIVKYIGAPADFYEGNPALFYAISMVRPAVVEALLKAGADPNQMWRGDGAQPETTQTPLTSAIACREAEMVRMLLRYGADPNLRTGGTPLAVAKATGHNEIARLLLAHGAEVTAAVCFTESPDADNGFEVTTRLAADLAEACKIMTAHAQMPIEGLQEQIASSVRSVERRTLLRLVRAARSGIGLPPSQEIDEAVTDYDSALLSMVGTALIFLKDSAGEAAKIVISNHVGLRNRKDDQRRARQRCVEEIAVLVAPRLDLPEDSEEALALAELVLSRLPYRQLVETAGSQPAAARNDGVGYEDECAALLAASGYLVRKTPTTRDQGADLLVTKAAVSYAVQCKNYSGSVGNSAVQEAIAARTFFGTDFAIVVSEGKFTSSAWELAARTNVLLVKKPALAQIDVMCSKLDR